MKKLLLTIVILANLIIYQSIYFQWVDGQRQMMEEYALDMAELQDQDEDKDWTDSGLEIPDPTYHDNLPH